MPADATAIHGPRSEACAFNTSPCPFLDRPHRPPGDLGVPYAIGARFAHPDRPAIAFIAVLHDNDLNQVTWELRAMSGAPKFEESQTLPDVAYPAGDRALTADRPVVLDVHCDPDATGIVKKGLETKAQELFSQSKR
nr:hypothetical protein GCM10010200_095890 [Actinomadura rugatobispora]